MQILEKYNQNQKIKLARCKNTSIEMLDELVKDCNIKVRIEVYRRIDFEKIKEFLSNLNQEEYKVFKISTERERQKRNTELMVNAINNTIKVVMIISTIMVISIATLSILILSILKIGSVLNV